MTGNATRRSRPVAEAVSTREEGYRAALAKHVAEASEATLGAGYELGRKYLTQGVSLLELASIHHEALTEILRTLPAGQRQKRLSRAAEFMSECLSPYEMGHRGFQEATAALRRMNEVLEEEVKRIAFAVHDEAGQLLVAVHLLLADIEREAPGSGPIVLNIRTLLKSVEVQLRQFSHELRPTILDDLGLVPAIRFIAEAVARRANLPITVEAKLSQRLSSNVAIAVYRAVQEALTNAAKHSGARHISIDISENAGRAHCLIRDDGIGFSASAAQEKGKRKGLGLVAMQERINAIGGTIRFDSEPGRGTTVRLSVPYGEEHR